ncbi:MAG: glycosyltransferase [Actinobacteria bacterium]|nr:glycosyltransferase [Actinomycetota bacterium]
MKILHGMTEMANQAAYSVIGLRENGYFARSATRTFNLYALPADFDVAVGRKNKFLYPWYMLQTLAFALYAIVAFDVFHFHAEFSLIPGHRDLPLLRLLKKDYYFEYHGDELRQGKAWLEGNPYASLIPEYGSNPEFEEGAKRVLAHAAGAIVHDGEIALYLPEFDGPTYFVPLRLNVGRFTPCYPSPEKERPLIVHAPTNSRVKGSDYIKEAIERLSKVYDFDFVLVEKMPQEDAFEWYSRADIIVDQLLVGAYGVFALEGMALGKPVITYIREDIIGAYPAELPIVTATVDTIYERIEYLLKDGELRHDLGIAGRRYVENYHDYRIIARLLASIYSTKNGPRTPLEGFSAVKALKDADPVDFSEES